MSRWDHAHAVVKERIFTIGRQYSVEMPEGQAVGYCKQKVFRLREDIRLFTGPDKMQELWRLKTNKILDFHAAFDLMDSASGHVLGHFRRRGWKSMFKPEWLLFDDGGREVGTFTVDSGWMVYARRNLPFGQLIFPTTYHLRLNTPSGPMEVAVAKERRRLFGVTFDVHRNPGATIDLRVVVALTILSSIFSESQGS